MVRRVRSLGISGIDGFDVSVECSLSGGLPNFDIVGLPDAAVRESRERVRAAVKNCGYKFPVSRVTVNLAPADRKKAGTLYDLPVFLSILAAAEVIRPLPDDCAFIGELSLSGEVRPVPGVLSMALRAGRSGVRRLFVPAGNAAEAAFAGGADIYPVADAASLLAHLDGTAPIAPAVFSDGRTAPSFGVDFSDVMGQENAKRALEIAAAGGHNLLLIGPPGAGKSMLAKRLPTILPDMTREELLETTAIYSVNGLTLNSGPVTAERPFRSPHHTVSYSAMVGGAQLQPGEISLAHNGVLFLDELPEFHRDVLEALRQPLEDGCVTVSRAAGTARYPSRFMLVCAMNPCRCGWYGHPSGRCRCTEKSVLDYRSKVSGPLLDRIDMHITVPAMEYDELRERVPSESSAAVRSRVNAARDIQRRRYAGAGVSCNAAMGSALMADCCRLDEKGEALMRGAFARLGLTARSFDRILRVARTIADLAGSESISSAHLAEAIQYRAAGFRDTEPGAGAQNGGPA